MKKTIVSMAFLVLFGVSSVVGGEKPEMLKGTLKANMDGKEFKVDVLCLYFDHDKFETHFMFISDQAKHKDIDGDGIVVRGDKKKVEIPGMSGMGMDGIEIDFKLNGDFYESSLSMSTAMKKKEKWSKTDKGVKGEVKLFKDGDAFTKPHSFVYEVMCK